MANPGRDQGHLGIDSNVLVAYLIPEHPDHERTRALARESHAINPTVLHEAYHACVFKLRRSPADTVKALLDYMDLATCLPISPAIVERGLKLALEHSLGGRDALILASYLSSKGVKGFVTMDKSLLSLKEVRFGERVLRISSLPTY
ncbi:MAG: PIN domain-containing protein [Nitrososphaerota archaeon]|nr:PIN domain-containing protein [Nitrososphaerota archaeon]MDG7026303.1 PIN domain-containing protein [Nitrososphaerota archaeon]